MEEFTISAYILMLMLLTSYLYIIKIIINRLLVHNKGIYKYVLTFYKANCVLLCMLCGAGLLIFCQVGGLIAILNILCFLYIICITGVFISHDTKQDYKYTKLFILFVVLSHIFAFIILYFTSTNTSSTISALYNNLKYFFIISVSGLPSLTTSYLFFYPMVVYYLPDTIQMTRVDNTHMIDDCPICLDTFSAKETVKLECSHHFHKECIEHSFKYNNKCPICRNNLMVSNSV
jgi:hypothetical protein